MPQAHGRGSSTDPNSARSSASPRSDTGSASNQPLFTKVQPPLVRTPFTGLFVCLFLIFLKILFCFVVKQLSLLGTSKVFGDLRKGVAFFKVVNYTKQWKENTFGNKEMNSVYRLIFFLYVLFRINDIQHQIK